MLIRFQHQDKRGRKVPGIKIMKWTMTSVLLVLGFTAMMLVQTGSGWSAAATNGSMKAVLILLMLLMTLENCVLCVKHCLHAAHKFKMFVVDLFIKLSCVF